MASGDRPGAMASYEFPTDGDRAFFERVYATDEAVYQRRIEAVGFAGLGWVLDAGCGYGQWSLSLAVNNTVLAVDISPHRLGIVAERARDSRRTVQIATASLEDLPLADACLDGVFCYSAIYFADYRDALREFYRVLRPGGRLYICLNDVGWFLWYLATNHNAGPNFRPRRISIEALVNTARVFAGGKHKPGAQMAVPARAMRRELGRVGFHNIEVAGEGHLGVPRPYTDAFFSHRWLGMRTVYEVVAEKGAQ